MGAGIAPSMALHGGPNSPFVRKVLIVAAEIGILEEIALVRTHPPATMARVNQGLMALHPLAKVPTLALANGASLYDSTVICDYLDATYGDGRFHPPTGPDRWKALRWSAFGGAGMDALILWRFERNRPEGEQSADVLQTFEAKIASALDAVDAEIPQLAAERFCIGHISLGCFLGYLDFRFPDIAWRGGRRAAAAWLDEFNARPSSRLTRHAELTAEELAKGPLLAWT